MRKTLGYGFKIFSYAWQANGLSALLAIISRVYDSTIYPLIQVFLLAKVLDLLGQFKSLAFSDIVWIIISYLVASILKFILKSYIDVKQAYLDTKLEGYIDLKINEKLAELDPATFEKPSFQNLLAQIEGVKGSFIVNLDRFTALVDAVFKFLTAAAVVLATFPLFVPLMILSVIPSYFVWERFRNKTWPYYVEKRTLVVRITQYIKNLLSADATSKETIILKTGPVLLNKIKREQQQYFTNFRKTNDPWITNVLLVRLFQFVIFIYTQYLNFARVFRGMLGIGQFSLVFQQTFNLSYGAGEILNQYSSIAARNKYVDRFFDFLGEKRVINSPVSPVLIPSLPDPATIEFKNVSFKYPDTERFILKNFNLLIKSKEKIAFVGENGAGKTTIIKLLLRFHDVQEGEILINGVNIKEANLDEWHKRVGVLFQDFIKYQFTFKENICFGDLKKMGKEKFLEEAIGKSGAKGFMSTLPNKYDQVLGKMFEGGIELSGGQWQKLALARTFFRNAPFLILDEPTSAIDAKAEYEIFERVQKLEKNKTVIIISHRFSTVRKADRILVLDEGKIIEEGSHEQLLKKKGMYAELFELQAKSYR
jgi:ABC-type multidrug transport system fused ATPase/permease subunit